MELSNEIKQILGEDSWQFYRCYKCGRTINALELSAGLKPPLGEGAKVCPCGSLRCQPAQITAEDYGKPQVLAMAKHLGFTKQQILDDFEIESVGKMASSQIQTIRQQIEEYFA